MSEFAKEKNMTLSVISVSKSGDGDLYAKAGLKNISFDFDGKGIHCILAPKGSGKTQLMNIIAGCDTADEGTVLVCGASAFDDISVKGKIGYLQKEDVLYPDMTASELMAFVGDVKSVESGRLYRQIKEALELVGLDDMKNKLVKNMTEYDKKKLALAVALLGNPDILLLDEPISSRMSAERREGLCAIIKMLGRIKPVVITTGDFKLARGLASDVVIISDGRVLAKGSFEALEAKLADSASPTTLEALYNSLSVVAE